MTGRVAWISIAPVKALALQQLESVELRREGLDGDRRFFLVDEDGRLVNDKQVGKLVQIDPHYDDAARTLELRFPDGTMVAGSVEGGTELIAAFWTIELEVRELDAAFSDAISDFAGKPLRLVMPERPAVDRGPSAVASMLSTSSLDELAAKLGAPDVDGRRFRMNFGVDGVEPHAEDGWIDRRVRIGNALVVPKGNIGRCAVTTQDPDTGAPDLDTLRALGDYRDGVETTERLPFGIYALVAEPGTVRRGDAVELVS